MRRAFFVAFGVTIDGLQSAFAVWLVALGGTIGGAAAGCAAGQYVAGKVGCAVGAAAFGFLGTFLNATPAGPALGAALAYIVSVCLTLGGGMLLVTLLAFSSRGQFWSTCFWRTLAVFGAELFPFLNFGIPGWTAYAWYCTAKIKEVEVQAAQKPQTQRAASVAFDGIRAAQSVAVVLALIFLAHGGSAYAQTLPPPIQYIVNPEAPGPNQSVTIEAQGVGSFLGSANLTWTQDGKAVEDGVGQRSYTFTTGSLGAKTTVHVSIDSSQGSFAQTFVFNPSLINLVWEADTSTPMLYKGKALYSAGSDYKVVALPSVYSGGVKVSPGALSYQWSRAGNLIPEQSGLGQFVLSLTGDQLQPSEDVSVDVYYGSSLAGRGSISIRATTPQIVLYPRDALRGELYDTALPSAISLVAKEITVQAEPFYFSNKARRSGLVQYVWTLNGEETTGPDSSRGILTLRQTGQGTGGATLGVSMQNNNADQFVQAASASLQLVFGAQTGNSLLNFFGL